MIKEEFNKLLNLILALIIDVGSVLLTLKEQKKPGLSEVLSLFMTLMD